MTPTGWVPEALPNGTFTVAAALSPAAMEVRGIMAGAWDCNHADGRECHKCR